MLGFAELAKIYLDAAETVAGTKKQDGNDISNVITLTQVFMGLDLNGDRLEVIDPSERPIYWSTIKDWVFNVLDRRYDFLCNLDSTILAMEKTYRQLDQDEATRESQKPEESGGKEGGKTGKKGGTEGCWSNG